MTYKKVSLVADDHNTPSTDSQSQTTPKVPKPLARTSLMQQQRPEKLDLENTPSKPSPRLSLKIYECKAGSSEFVEKSGCNDNNATINDSMQKSANLNGNKSANEQAAAVAAPSSPVTLRQKPVEMRKLVDLKQPEPNGLWRRGGEDRASDR